MGGKPLDNCRTNFIYGKEANYKAFLIKLQ
jgi:hypothetical protein